MSPVSTMMIHNPATIAFGDHTDMQKAIDMLNEVKESIINAYVIKTGLSRSKLSHLMDAETWMNANKAIELGFADGLTSDNDLEDKGTVEVTDVLFSCRAVNNALINKLEAKYSKPKQNIVKQAEISVTEKSEHSVNDIMERLDNIKRFI